MRWLWNTIGCLALAAGALGTVLPLLPATPFLLLAAYAFSRGSPRFESWLLRHPSLGTVIANWRRERAISKKTKTVSLAAMCATPVLSWALGVGPVVLAIQVAVLVMASLFIVTRPKPTKDS